MIVTCHCFFHHAKKLRSGAIVRFSDNSSFFHFPAHYETFSNGQSVELAAPVGLLTRNIKIIGGEDSEKLLTENYGARVLVSLLSTKDRTYIGINCIFMAQLFKINDIVS